MVFYSSLYLFNNFGQIVLGIELFVSIFVNMKWNKKFNQSLELNICKNSKLPPAFYTF